MTVSCVLSCVHMTVRVDHLVVILAIIVTVVGVVPVTIHPYLVAHCVSRRYPP